MKIFPCNADKIPLIKNWQESATDDPNQINNWRQQFGPHLVYFGVPTGPINDLLVLDVDVKKGVNGFDSLKDFPIPPTTTQVTRSGGKHFIFKYPKDGAQYGNRAGIKPGLDIRGAGGYIIYYGFDQTPTNDPPEALLAPLRFKNAPEVQGSTVKVSTDITQVTMHNALEAIRLAPAGEGNNTLNTEAFKIGQLVAAGSISRQFAEEILFKAAKERGRGDYEARATIASALDGAIKKPLTTPFGEPVIVGSVPPPPAAPVRWTPLELTLGDLLDRSKLRKPQLFEHWSTEDISITTADGGTGKTTLKLFEAMSLALGTRFLGFDCKQRGNTLFITGEDTDKKLAAMLGAIMHQMGLFEKGVGNEGKVDIIRQSIRIKKDADLCLIMKDKFGFLHLNPDAMRKVLEACEDFKPKMIVFDPIASFWGSESALNDMNKAVTKFMSELVERTGACVEMINHMGKQSSATKDMSQFAGRGGSGLPSNARVSRVLRPVYEEEYRELTNEDLAVGQSAMMCNVNKFSDGSPLLNKQFLILRDGFLFKRVDLSTIKAQEAEKQLTDVERVFTLIKSERLSGKYPTKGVLIGKFALSSDPLSKAKVDQALKQLVYEGHMGEKIALVENPDQTIRDKVYVVTDLEGKEL